MGNFNGESCMQIICEIYRNQCCYYFQLLTLYWPDYRYSFFGIYLVYDYFVTFVFHISRLWMACWAMANKLIKRRFRRSLNPVFRLWKSGGKTINMQHTWKKKIVANFIPTRKPPFYFLEARALPVTSVLLWPWPTYLG